MRFGSWIAAAGVAGMMGAGAAQAAPLVAPAATLQTAVDNGPAPQVELVRGGCGFREHRTRFGCRLNHRYYYRRGRRLIYRYYR